MIRATCGKAIHKVTDMKFILPRDPTMDAQFKRLVEEITACFANLTD